MPQIVTWKLKGDKFTWPLLTFNAFLNRSHQNRFLHITTLRLKTLNSIISKLCFWIKPHLTFRWRYGKLVTSQTAAIFTSLMSLRMSLPYITAVPDVGGYNPLNILIVVVLPAPLCPKRVRICKYLGKTVPGW